MASSRFRAPDFDYRQPRRHEEHVDSSGQHHACAHRPGEQGRCGNYGWIITNCCRVGRLQGYPGRSGQGIERRLTLCSAANRPPHDRQQYRRNDYSTTPLIIAILGTQVVPGIPPSATPAPDSQDERFIEHLLQLADFLVGQQMDEQGRGNLVFRNFRTSLRLSHPS